MKMINEFDVFNKRVIVRVDYNVPIKDGFVTDNNRIVSSLKTVNYLIENGAKVILMSHLGKVKSREDALKNDLRYGFSESLVGNDLENAINNMNSGDVLLLQNTRFMDLEGNKESGCDEELSKYWASLCDLYIMDAFASAHRAHASTYGIAKYVISGIGFLMKKEMDLLNDVINVEDKVLILGGAKAEDKIMMIDYLAPKSKYILIGGLMSMPFLKAKGFNTGASSFSNEALFEAQKLYAKYGEKIVLPVDFCTAKRVEDEPIIKDINMLNSDDYQYDIGPKTIELFKEKLFTTTFVLWNGPVGYFEYEKYANGTKILMDFLSDFNAKVVLAGGDTGNASKSSGLEELFIVSTGGGASLEYLSGKEFPIIRLLNTK